MIKTFFILLLLTHFSLKLFAADIKLEANVDKALVHTGDIVMFKVVLDAPQGLSVPIPNVGDKIQGFRIVDFGTEPEKTIDDRTVSSNWYKLQADLTGSYILPSVQITYKNSKGEEETLKSSEIFVEVASVLNKENAKDIRDIKPIILFPPVWPYYLGVVIIIILIIIALIYLYKKRKKKSVGSIYTPPAHEVALSELSNLTLTPIKLFAFNLSAIIRTYFESRFNQPVTDRTLEEIKRDIDLTNELAEELKQNFLMVLEKTELLKFTDIELTQVECLKLVEMTKVFVEKTKTQVTESKKVDLEDSVI